ncbi:hypothetical protein cypCar_00007708, partial [Cyprinus carpio]
LLIKSRKEAIKDLEELCEQLQERNLQMARSIMDTDRSSFARTNELLIQTEQKRVSEIRSTVALKRWKESLVKSAKTELRDIKEASQTHLSERSKCLGIHILCAVIVLFLQWLLMNQLDLLKVKVVEAQKELRRLKTYKDMEFPVKGLQIADMERKLDRLKEMEQKEQKELNLFFKKEMVNLERRQCEKEQVLSAVVEKHASHFPSIVKLMASQNDTMREEIHKQKRVVLSYLKMYFKVYY